MAAPPAWVIAKLRQLVAEGDSVPLIVEHLSSLNFSCTERQVRRWKEKHGIRRVWEGSDAALDSVVHQLAVNEEFGDEEGYRWVASVVNRAIPGPRSVGVARVCKSLRRVMPAKVDARKAIVEKRLQRRVYVADYYGQRAHIDLECKLQFGGTKLYIYGHVCRRLCPSLRPHSWPAYPPPACSSSG